MLLAEFSESHPSWPPLARNMLFLIMRRNSGDIQQSSQHKMSLEPKNVFH